MRRSGVAHRGTCESLGAPPRLVVVGRDLHERALRQPLGQLVALPRQPRLVGDATGQRRGDGHNDMPRPGGRPVGHDEDAAAVLRDRTHRAVEDDPIAECAGEPDRDRLRALDEPHRLRATAGVDEPFERAGR